MFRQLSVVAVLVAVFSVVGFTASCQAQQAYGRSWARANAIQDWERFYHYPFVYYPQNFWTQEYYQSGDSLYYRYPPEMRIPVYNKKWYNYYPAGRKYHRGHHFILDVF